VTDGQPASELTFAQLTTLRLGGPSRIHRLARTDGELIEAVERAARLDQEVFILGGGSNVVVGDDGFHGATVQVLSRGIEHADSGTEHVQVEAAAGEDWDAFVVHCMESGLAGVEGLSGIPGTVGAIPIQNVNAYDYDAEDVILDVRVYDRRLRRVVRLTKETCEFDYRDSRLKRERDRYVVLSVRFRLRRASSSRAITSQALCDELGLADGQTAAIEAVREAVLTLRRTRGMLLNVSDHDTWSVGSFFLNPSFEDPSELAQIAARIERKVGVPPPVHTRKRPGSKPRIPAGWLIEKAGFEKGFPLETVPRAGVSLSTKHALALTNRGSGTTRELLLLAGQISAGVRDAFHIDLKPEPRLVACTLDS
jgi:UDP-N-acetylmuramate dehydrogenase